MDSDAAGSVDPAASIGPGVELSPPSWIEAGAVLRGPLVAGAELRVEARALVGGPAQHREGHTGRLVLGRRVHLHEGSTVHRGSPAGDGVTRLGDGVRVMAYAHVGHDVVLEDGVTLANGAQLGGHVHVGRGATIGARAALHQFVRVGQGSMVAAGAFVSGDVLPWTLVAGDRARVRGVNRVALGRAGFGDVVAQVSRLARALSPGSSRARTVDEARHEALERWGSLSEPAAAMLAFAAAAERRPLCPFGKT
jgi:UDP-N-acetylglucosamine acyltransferase